MARIFLSSLGCKLNQAEVEAYTRRFELHGHTLVGSLENADVHVVNTCTVTHAAARDSRKLARRGARVNEHLRTVLTGCYATGSGEEAEGLKGVSLVVPNSKKDDLVDHLYRKFPDLMPSSDTSSAASCAPESLPRGYVPMEFGNTRGAIKVEDGCNMTCSYCIIPSTRGRQRSRGVTEVVEELEQLVDRGYQELVVTGVQISSYRDGDQRLVDLVQSLLSATEVPRLRLSSIAPWQFDRALLDLWPNPRLCRHFHISLQSGCNTTLKRMRRPYSKQQYLELLGLIRDRIDGVAITTDVIVGFPGETEHEFDESLAFVEQAKFSRVHVFPYSERAGTRSAQLLDNVSPLEKKGRVKAMREVGADMARAFALEQVGKAMGVLWEKAVIDDAGIGIGAEVMGTSDNYLRVCGTLASHRSVGMLTNEVVGWAREGVLHLEPFRGPRKLAAGGRRHLPVLA